MSNLSKDLIDLRELSRFRERARELREMALIPLKKIKDIDYPKKVNDGTVPQGEEEKTVSQTEKKITSAPSDPENKKDFDIDFKRWIFGGDNVEVALLVKVQNNRDFSEDDNENVKAEAAFPLKKKLRETKLESLFRAPDVSDKINSIPVLTAARTMQALVSRAETVFSHATIFCYYRILRDMYEAAPTDWAVGASRAGIGGGTSAFVTGECIRAISAFQKSIDRTADFFHYTKILLRDYERLRGMIDNLGPDTNAANSEENKTNGTAHPLHIWADKTMEAIGLDCYLSTNPRRRQIALSAYDDLDKEGIVMNRLRLFAGESVTKTNGKPANADTSDTAGNGNSDGERINVVAVGEYFNDFCQNLRGALEKTKMEFEEAIEEIKEFRKGEKPEYYNEKENIILINEIEEQEKPEDFDEKKQKIIEEVRAYERLNTPHLFAYRVILDGFERCNEALKSLNKCFPEDEKPAEGKVIDDAKIPCLLSLLDEFTDKAKGVAGDIVKVIEPAKRYLETVIYRELSANETDFDAGELVFAATALGALTDWKQQELLHRICEMLVKALPENGRLHTHHPFHTTQNGYRLIPIGCELTNNLAQLFEKVDFPLTPQVVGRMLSIFEGKQIEVGKNKEGKKVIGWNFDRAPNPTKPCVWVTAISVIALDRIIRMLNTRINETVFKHFEVFRPEKPHTKLKLYDLIYSDHGLSSYYVAGYDEFYYKKLDLKKTEKKSDSRISIAFYLQLMRAHLMRAALPASYRKMEFPKWYSTILYGPPGTGKTTLAESLALSSEKAVVSLSPSDLVVQGQELIEGRARDVFEALSMLSQAVIIFDEFEPVVKRRDGDEDDSSKNKDDSSKNKNNSSKDKNNSPEKEEDPIVKQLRIISSKDDPRFKFLLGGMLPKFIKLHDAAKHQSLVYFLGTNHLKEIDEAAKRPGRFDTKIPVYNPCPLSRAGTLLYRLSKEDTKPDFNNNKWQVERFLEVVRNTAFEPASELGQKLYKEGSDNIKYILNEEKENIFESKKNKPLPIKETSQSDEEVEERKWLNNFEETFKKESLKIQDNEPPMKVLKECLIPEEFPNHEKGKTNNMKKN